MGSGRAPNWEPWAYGCYCCCWERSPREIGTNPEGSWNRREVLLPSDLDDEYFDLSCDGPSVGVRNPVDRVAAGDDEDYSFRRWDHREGRFDKSPSLAEADLGDFLPVLGPEDTDSFGRADARECAVASSEELLLRRPRIRRHPARDDSNLADPFLPDNDWEERAPRAEGEPADYCC